MTIYGRPDEKVMAESAFAGEVQDFPDILRGWGITIDETGGFPPMEWFNALAKRTDQAIRYFMQRGLPEWSATEDYPLGSYVQYAGNAYLSKRANTNKIPTANVNDWGRWSVTRDEFDAAGAAARAPRLKVFTSSGSFTVPDGVTTIYRSGCGGGGGGGGGGTTVGNVSFYGAGGGAGGGGGVAAIRDALVVTPGQIINITIGTGGQGSLTRGTNGSAGGATVIGVLTLSGGMAGGAGAAQTSTNGIGTAGGTPQGAQVNPSGQCGGDGNLAGLGGMGASGPFGGGGGGGRAGTTSAIDGFPASGKGAGGGGGGGSYGTAAGAGSFGAAGTPGIAIIEW